MIDWKIIKRENLPRLNKHEEECFCGKMYSAWTKVYKIWKKIEGKRKPETSIIKENIGYPQNSCHCQCGIKWGEHYANN